MALVNQPRIMMGHWPTPMQKLPGLSDSLNGPGLYIKREDLNGLGLGGNKCRKLEFVLADAQRRGVDTLITSGSSQSNFALQMAAAARKVGMEPYLLLVKGEHTDLQGNLLLHNILGSNVKIVAVDDPKEMFSEIPARMQELADDLKRQGRHPLVIPAGAFMPLGTAGWVNAAEEIYQQAKRLEIDIKYVVLANGSGGTQAGLILGFNQLNSGIKVVGISVLYDKKEATDIVTHHIQETAELLNLKVRLEPEDVVVYDDYIGSGYGIPTSQCIQAIQNVARTEGIFLDPVYTGKAMAGLIDLVERGIFAKTDGVLFIHTGGVAADFAYNKELIA